MFCGTDTEGGGHLKSHNEYGKQTSNLGASDDGIVEIDEVSNESIQRVGYK